MTKRIVMIAALLLAPAAVEAQRPLTLSLAGGASVGVGRFGDALDPGWHALVAIGLSSLMQPIGLRADIAHNRFGSDVAGLDQGVTSATANLSYRLPMTNSPLSPYLIMGAGAYRFECFGTIDCGSDTNFGWNAGLGTKIAMLGGKWFLESRFHAINDDGGNVRFVPVTLGLTF